MSINVPQLQINVNLHALQPGFKNSELYYVLATTENNFRFAGLSDAPSPAETRYYCFYTDTPLTIPAGNISLPKSYVLQTESPYTVVNTAEDIYPLIDCIESNDTCKAVRNFPDHEIDGIFNAIKAHYGSAEKHLIQSPEFQHLLILLPGVEISVSATMVYFKKRIALTTNHYQHLKQEAGE